MSPQQFRLIDQIFQRAVELPPAERLAYLDVACQGETELRQCVEELLLHDSQASGVINRAVGEAAAEMLQIAQVPMIGRHIGPYRIVREVGKGGMGTVYQAVRSDSQYVRSVAIKFIRRGMDTPEALARFRLERQVLAALQHPNIATLLDGGTTEDGWPYIIMEYIEGEPLLEYCQQRKLSVAERLTLFCSLCGAVNHAHQMLVIHRDLKPGNVLVAPEGVPKLLDFGIAKLLVPELSPNSGFATVTGMHRLTPQYASPEQIRGDVLTTASDVYSLGVLLYELLTYTSPYQTTGRSLAEIEHAVCHQEPTRLSRAVKDDPRLRRQLEGDLDNIVAMAMRKEPQRRYNSALLLADDLQRFLKGLPVNARDETLLYLASKFVRRNKLTVAAFSLLAVSVAAGWTATIHEARRTEARFREVRELSNALLTEIPGEISQLPGSIPVRAKLVQRALKYLHTLSQDAAQDVGLQFELAQAYDRVGDVQGDPTGPNLGQFREATDSYQRAIGLADKVADKRRDFAVLHTIGWLHVKIGDLQARNGKSDEAQARYRQGVKIAGAIQNDLHDARGYDLAREGWQRSARLYNVDRQIDQALQASQAAVEAARRFAAAEMGEDGSRGIAAAQIIHGDLLVLLGRLREARQGYEEAVSRLERVSQNHPQEARLQEELAEAYRRLGNLLGAPIYFNFGEPAQAEPYLVKALDIERRRASHDTGSVQGQSRLALAYRRLAYVQLGQKPEQAAANFEQAIGISAKLLQGHPEESNHLRDLTNHRQGYGQALLRLQRSGAAREELNEVLAVQRRLVATVPRHMVMKEDLFHSLLAMSRLELETGRPGIALQQVEEALMLARTLRDLAPGTLYAERCVAVGLQAMGDVQGALAVKAGPEQREEHRAAAVRAYKEALAVWTDWRKKSRAEPYTEQREREVSLLLRRMR